jgi:hypothetical protein
MPLICAIGSSLGRGDGLRVDYSRRLYPGWWIGVSPFLFVIGGAAGGVPGIWLGARLTAGKRAFFRLKSSQPDRRGDGNAGCETARRPWCSRPS